MTQEILNKANEVVRAGNFSTLTQVKGKPAICHLIVSTRDFALYMSYSTGKVYGVGNQGQVWKLA